MIPITGIVVSFNEITRLHNSLGSLSFCSQLIVIDLGSTDGSLEIAKKFTKDVYSWPREPFVEVVLVKALPLAKNEWIISQDPDEVFPQKLADQVHTIILTNPKIGKILTPIQFYFLGKPLDSTIWGGKKTKGRVFNKERTLVIPEVHQRFQVLAGFETIEIPFEYDNAIQHYWVDSIPEMISKHWRYIKAEGKSKYSSGERFTLKTVLGATYFGLTDNLFKRKGISDGWRGIFLSFFYAWYVIMSYLSLFWYQTFIGKNHDHIPQ